MISVMGCAANMSIDSQGCNVIVLDPDVAAVFPDSESVNQALRRLAEIIRNQAEKGQS